MRYTVVLRRAAEKALDKLPHWLQDRIRVHIDALADNPRPHGCVKLTGSGEYRIRVGDYRVVYLIEDARLVVIVVRVGPRGDVYR